MLHVERFPAAIPQPTGVAGDPVVLLHGFTQSGPAWRPVRPALAAAGHAVVTVDAPGHGASGAVRADLWTTARLMVEAAGAGSYVGYSMGARMALHVALAHPAAVARLVLVSGTPGIEDPAVRAGRRRSDEEIACRVERDGVEPFVRWWLDRPLFATLPPTSAALDSRLGATPAGLASSLRLAGTGAQESLWGRLGEIAVPTLVVAGELDPAYRQLARRMVEAIGASATLAVIEGAGHAAHLERPDAFCAVLLAFLARDIRPPAPRAGGPPPAPDGAGGTGR